MAYINGNKVLFTPVQSSKLPQVIDKSVIEITELDLQGATNIGERVFYKCLKLTKVTLPSSVTSIGPSVFYGCSSLTSITLPSSVASIGDSAFYGCSSLLNVTIPNGVISLGLYIFRDCSSLTNITIPSSVTSIGSSAFYGCTALTEMTILATTPPTLANKNAIPNETTTIYIPKGTLSAYSSATNWSTFASRFVELEA